MRNSEFPYKGDYAQACISKLEFTPKMSEIICNWVKNPKDMMLLLGVPGTGKTYFCAALYHYFVSQKKHVQILNEMDFLNNLKENISRGWSEYYEISKLADQQILIFDDMGSGKLNEWHLDVLFQLVDKRSEGRLPTVITSNIFTSKFNSVFPERLTSRLTAVRNVILELTVEDLRKFYT